MSVDLSVHPEVEVELRSALVYYRENASTAIATKFLKTYDAAILGIYRHPHSFSIFLENYRRKVTGQFPFSIFYSLKHSEVRTLALAHQSRDPLYWLGRE